MAGTLNLRAADLSAWSALAGTGLRGRLGLDLALGTRSGQSVDASVDGAGLGGGGVTAGTIRAALHLEDLRRAPHGTATLRAATVQAGAGVIDHLALDGRIAGLGSIGLTATGAGSVAGHPVDAAAEATLGLGQDTQSLELDHARLAIGGLAARLERPVQLTRRGDAVAISGLEATVNRGHLAGSGRFDGHTVEVTLSAADLPVGAAAALIGRPNVDGSLGLDLALTGPLAAPRGEARLALDHLRITSAGVRPPALALVASAALSPGRLDFKGRLDGAGETAALGFAGTVPLTSGSAWPVLDRGGRLSGQLEGAGSLAALQELAPIGEDRLDGRYAIDLTVGGTPAAPEAGGTLRISDAGYDNQLSGLTLRGLQMVLTGRNQAYELTRFEATDGAAGRLTASGRLELGAEGGPRFDLAAVLCNFTAARTDALGGSVSGSARIDGTLTNPRVSGELTIDQATVSLPERLPPDIVVLDVIRIDSRHPGAKPVRPPPPAPPIVAQLEVSVHDPGPSFVRGRGLDSEWKGDLAIRGTSAAPLVTGQLSAINGTYALLGTDFSISRGLVYFTGSLEPSFDIEAQAAATDITAVVDLRGTPTKPGLTLSSTPVLPQDEILSRLLFGSGTSQLNPAQGLELAQAAASLAGGGGPGVIDRLRNFTGLDRLSLGSAAPDPGRSPPPGGSGTGSGTTLSGGNYVAPGVFVGAAQGLGGATRAKVAITISPHVTVNAATGTGGPEGSTVGVQYQRDY